MKKILLTLLLLPALSFAKCSDHIKGSGTIKTESRTLDSFNRLAASGSIDIIIEQGNGDGVEVTADDNLLNYIITEVKNNTLSVHLKENVSVNSNKLVVKVKCIRLSEISAGGSGDIKTKGELKSEQLSINQGGSGDFKLNVNVGVLKISKAGSGDFHIEGKVASMDVSSAGSGDLDASKILVGDVEISMAGSGDIILPKGSKAKVSSVGSGEVHYE